MDTAQAVSFHNVSSHSCKFCVQRSYCLASGLETKQLEQFESNRGSVRILRKGQYLYYAGERFSMLHIVRSGMLKTTVTANDGEEQITGFYLPGDMLGMDGIGDNTYNTTAVALETSSVCAFSFQKLTALGGEFPELQQQLWRQTGRGITAAQNLLLSISHKDAEARIAGFFLSLSRRFRRIGYSGTSFYLPMGRHDIGNYLGMALETVCRVLTRFEKDGLIKKERKNINLVNIPALTEVYYGKPAVRHVTRGPVFPPGTAVFTPFEPTDRKSFGRNSSAAA